MNNAMLCYMVRQGHAKFAEGSDGIETYLIGNNWLSVNSQADTFNQKVHSIGTNDKDDDGVFLSLGREWEWGIYKANFKNLASFEMIVTKKKRFDQHPKKIKITVAFQYIFNRFVGTINEEKDTKVLRCVVCEHPSIDSEGADEILNTDFDCWEDVQSFLENEYVG